MHIYLRASFVVLLGVTMFHACVDSRRTPTAPSPSGVQLPGQTIGWECLRLGGPGAENVTGPWTFPAAPSACPAIASTTPAEGAPVNGPVLNLRATVAGTTVRLDFDYPVNEFVNGFQVEAGSGPGLANLAVLLIPSAPNFLIVTNVPDGVYFVRVRGTGGPLGPPSNEIIVQVGAGPCSPPGPPVNFTHNVAGSNVFLLWGAPTSGGAPATYIIEAGTATGLANLVVFDTGSLATSLVVGAPNGLYFTRLRARNACGTSGPSNERVIAVGVTTTTTAGPSTTTTAGPSTTTTAGPSTTTTVGPGTSTTTTSSTTISSTTTSTTTTTGPSFSTVYSNMGGCQTSCHGNNMFPMAAGIRFFNQSDAFNFAVARSDAGNPDGSTFLVKASGGASHSGGVQWPFGGSAYNTAKTWMTSGQAP